MTRYVLPLEVIGLLLTAALIGGTLIALRGDDHADQSSPAPSVAAPPHPHS